jgi:hypothetical protein
MQELLQRHARARRRRVATLALVALLGIAGAALALKDGANAPEGQTPQELNSVVP